MAVAYNPPPLRRPRIRAVIWDYDGTLVATRPQDERAVAGWVAGDVARVAGAEVFWQLEGMPLRQRLEIAWPGHCPELVSLFDGPEPPEVYPGIVSVVRRLWVQGIPMGVVSSRMRASLERGLRAVGLRDACDVVLGCDSVRHPKPDPEGLLRAAAALGATPDACVFVGDTDTDVLAGRSAGVLAWRATWGARRAPSTVVGTPLLSRPVDLLARLELSL